MVEDEKKRVARKAEMRNKFVTAAKSVQMANSLERANLPPGPNDKKAHQGERGDSRACLL